MIFHAFLTALKGNRESFIPIHPRAELGPRYLDITDSYAMRQIQVTDHEKFDYKNEIMESANYYKRKTSFLQYLKMKRTEKVFQKIKRTKTRSFNK